MFFNFLEKKENDIYYFVGYAFANYSNFLRTIISIKIYFNQGRPKYTYELSKAEKDL